MEKKEIENRRKSNPLWSGIKVVLVAAQLIASVALVISMLSTGIASGLIIAITIIILVALLILNIMMLLVRKKTSVTLQVICSVIAVVVVGVCIFGMRYTDSFNGFLNKITEHKPETKEYSVSVMNDSQFTRLTDLKQKSIGFLRTDTKSGNAEQYLQNQVEFEASFYDDLDILAGVLTGDVVSAIVLETSRIAALQEEDNNPLKNTRVIYTFEIEIEGDDAEVSEKKLIEEPFLIYISGSDSRTGLQTVARSDVNILAAVNPSDGKMLLVSIPRDMYVQLHDTVGLRDKLTHAGIYGIDMSKNTIEDFLGVNIDHTIKVSFDTVVKVVDQLDGIEINSDQAMTLSAEHGKKCEYVVGKQKVDGDCALRFARERKSYETGDRHRGENQQEVITGIVNKLSGSKSYLLKLPTILNIAADSFETTLSRDEITEFIRMQLQNPLNWKVESISVNGTGAMEPTYSMGANLPLYVMIPDNATVINATNKINEYLKQPTGETAEQGETASKDKTVEEQN